MKNPLYVIENYIVEMRVRERRGEAQLSAATVAHQIAEELRQRGFELTKTDPSHA